MITQDQLNRIVRQIDIQVNAKIAVAQLRINFPEIHFTYCMDDDVVAAAPVYEDAAFNLYLIDSRNHCLCFTQDMAVATGVVLAEKELVV